MIVMRVCRCPSSFWLKTVVGQWTYLITWFIFTQLQWTAKPLGQCGSTQLRVQSTVTSQIMAHGSPSTRNTTNIWRTLLALAQHHWLSCSLRIQMALPSCLSVSRSPLCHLSKKKPNGHYVSLHTVMRALVPANFELMPVPEKGSEKKDTDTPETPCLDASKK